MTKGPESEAIPYYQRKYFLLNEQKQGKDSEDCSLFVRDVNQEELGVYTCIYHKQKLQSWSSGFVIHKITLVADLDDATTQAVISPITVATTLLVEGEETNTTTTELRVTDNSSISTFATLAGDEGSIITIKANAESTTIRTPISEAVEMKLSTAEVMSEKERKDMTKDIDRAITTTVIVTETMGTTQKLTTTSMTSSETSTESPSVALKLTTVIENNSNETFDNIFISTSQGPLRLKTTQKQPDMTQTESTMTDYDLPDNSWTQFETNDNVRTIKKRDAKWKAYGFDSSVLQISDPWAKRNLWFQQVTHSVRIAAYGNCPCVVKVPAPSTWPSILETIPEPLLFKCQMFALSWLLYKQRAARDHYMSLSIHLFRPARECKWMADLPYLDLTDKHEELKKVPDSLEVQPTQAKACFCSNNTYEIDYLFMGMSDCEMYMMQFDVHKNVKPLKEYEVTFHIPGKKPKILSVINQTLPANVSIGNFRDIWWICGKQAYIFLPHGWTGCCYMATLKLPWDVSIIKQGKQQESSGGRMKREMATFSNLESYHWRISLAEKWGIGLFPWYGVTFLADHIDNITYTIQGFANETIKGFEYLSNTQKSHRLTLLKHDMALDYILAKQGGLCVSLNLTGDACYTLVPDNSDNLTSVIDALKVVRDAFGPSRDAGWSANNWLQEKFGPMGAVIVQVVVSIVLSLCTMFCFCSILLTFAKAMIIRWAGVFLPGGQTQMPLIIRDDLDNDNEEIECDLFEAYPF